MGDCGSSVTPGEIIVNRGISNYTYFYNSTAVTTPASDSSGCSSIIQTEQKEVGIGRYEHVLKTDGC